MFTDDSTTIGDISAATDDNLMTDRSDRYPIQFNLTVAAADPNENILDESFDGGSSVMVTLTTAQGTSTVTELRVPDSLVYRQAVTL